MQTRMRHGELNVSRYLYTSRHIRIHVHDHNAVVVKMDWCSTDINGTKLDPKVQYPEMVRKIH